MKTMNATPDRLRVETKSRVVGVDREARVLRGYVVAQEGPFKSEGRGEFDEVSLQRLLTLWPKNGLKSRFAHPNESSDGLGKYLGRARDPYLSTVTVERDGKPVGIRAVRADLHLDSSAFEKNPSGNLGEYVLTLAESDPTAISSSLVLSKDEEYRLAKDGTRLRDDNDELLPPLWRPKRLYASDVVDEGDAVDGILSTALSPESAGKPLRYTRDFLSVGESLLNQLFAGQSRGVVRSRVLSHLNRYLDRRYGPMANERLGATLGGVLDGYIEQATSDERPREVILAQMAEAASMPVEEVSAIVQGDDVNVTLPALQAFAKVLGCPLGELVTAAEADGIDFSGSAEEPEKAPTEEPPSESPPPDSPAPMRRVSILKRRLALKEKA